MATLFRDYILANLGLIEFNLLPSAVIYTFLNNLNDPNIFSQKSRIIYGLIFKSDVYLRRDRENLFMNLLANLIFSLLKAYFSLFCIFLK
jgi:hypothetical protein